MRERDLFYLYQQAMIERLRAERELARASAAEAKARATWLGPKPRFFYYREANCECPQAVQDSAEERAREARDA